MPVGAIIISNAAKRRSLLWVHPHHYCRLSPTSLLNSSSFFSLCLDSLSAVCLFIAPISLLPSHVSINPSFLLSFLAFFFNRCNKHKLLLTMSSKSPNKTAPIRQSIWRSPLQRCTKILTSRLSQNGHRTREILECTVQYLAAADSGLAESIVEVG